MLVQASGNRLTTFDAYDRLGLGHDQRRYDEVAVACRLLGMSARLRLLTNNPEKLVALRAAGVAVAGHRPLAVGASPFNRHYLAAKSRSGHLFAPDTGRRPRCPNGSGGCGRDRCAACLASSSSPPTCCPCARRRPRPPGSASTSTSTWWRAGSASCSRTGSPAAGRPRRWCACSTTRSSSGSRYAGRGWRRSGPTAGLRSCATARAACSSYPPGESPGPATIALLARHLAGRRARWAGAPGDPVIASLAGMGIAVAPAAA